MRFLFSIIAVMSFVFAATAQETSVQAPKRELGFLGAIGAGDEGTMDFSAGIHFTRHISPAIAYRVGIGYGGFNGYGLNFERTVSDSSVTTGVLQPYTPMGYFSAGLQAQRNFYKKVALYCGVDLGFAYGKGSADTTFKTEYISGGGAIRVGGSLNDVRMSKTDLTPYLGVKLKLKRLVLGTEATLIHLNYITQKFPDFPGDANTLNFDFGSLEQRFYVGWRF